MKESFSNKSPVSGARLGRHEKLLLLCIFLLAFVVRIEYIGNLIDDFNMVSSGYDTVDYHWLAQNIIRGRGYETFTGTSHRTTLLRPPLYPLFLTATYLTFGKSFVFARLVDITLSCLTIIFLYLLGRRLYGIIPAVMASAIMVFFARSIFLATHLYSDNLFCFLFILFLYFLLAGKESTASYAWAGFISGLLFLTRSIWLPVIPFICLWMVIVCRRRVAHVVLLITVFLMVLAPWVFYCTFVKHIPFSPALFSSTLGAENLWGATNPELGDFALLGATAEREHEQELKKITLKRYEHYQLSETDYIRRLREESRGFFLSRPWSYPRLAVVRLKRRWLASGLVDGQETLLPVTGMNRFGILYWQERIVNPEAYYGQREVIDAVWRDTTVTVLAHHFPLLSFEGVAYVVLLGFGAGLLLYRRDFPRKFGVFLKRSLLLIGTMIGYTLINLIGITIDRYRYPLDLIVVMWAGIALYVIVSLVLLIPNKVIKEYKIVIFKRR